MTKLESTIGGIGGPAWPFWVPELRNGRSPSKIKPRKARRGETAKKRKRR